MTSWLKKFKAKKKECFFCKETFPSSNFFAMHVKSADETFTLDACSSCIEVLEDLRYGINKMATEPSRGQLHE